MTEEQIIEIIKLEAHKNLTIVDEGTDSYNDYVIRGVDLMAKSLVKLFAIPDVVCSCYMCGKSIEQPEEQYDIYGEMVCQDCWDYNMYQALQDGGGM